GAVQLERMAEGFLLLGHPPQRSREDVDSSGGALAVRQPEPDAGRLGDELHAEVGGTGPARVDAHRKHPPPPEDELEPGGDAAKLARARGLRPPPAAA